MGGTLGSRHDVKAAVTYARFQCRTEQSNGIDIDVQIEGVSDRAAAGRDPTEARRALRQFAPPGEWRVLMALAILLRPIWRKVFLDVSEIST